jgi:hypothetical protein
MGTIIQRTSLKEESMEVVKGSWSDGMTSVSAMNCCTLLVKHKICLSTQGSENWSLWKDMKRRKIASVVGNMQLGVSRSSLPA